jgi:hypothetical protein
MARFTVLPANIFDSLISGSDYLDTNAIQVNGTTPPVFPSNFASLVISAGGVIEANMASVSGDATAADNFETMLDGTGGQTLSLGRLRIIGSVDPDTGKSAVVEIKNTFTPYGVGLVIDADHNAFAAYSVYGAGLYLKSDTGYALEAIPVVLHAGIDGDVGGKILGTGSSVITAAGAWVCDKNLIDLDISQLSTTDSIQPAVASALADYPVPSASDLAARTKVAADYADSTNQSLILDRLGPFSGTGVNTVLGFFKALFSKAASTPGDIGGTFSASTDSLEAIRDTEPLGTAMRGTDNAVTAGAYVLPPTVEAISAQVKSDLEATHGTGSWTGGGATAEEIADLLETEHGTGAWTSVDVPTASENAEAIADLLETEHGTGDWSVAGLAIEANVQGHVTDALTAYDPPTKAEMDTAIAGLNGAGARTVTITVNDGTDALEGARVRMTNGADSFVVTTNASGVAVFALDDKTWAVAITHSSYSFTPTTLVVSADTTHTYSMSAITIAASDPTFVTGYTYAYDELGAVEEGAVFELVLYTGTGSGRGYDSKTRTATSSATGLVQFTNLLPGASYMIRRGNKKVWNPTDSDDYTLVATAAPLWKKFTIAADATSPYALPVGWGEETT